jgi:sulfatase modifying factor 1
MALMRRAWMEWSTAATLAAIAACGGSTTRTVAGDAGGGSDGSSPEASSSSSSGASSGVLGSSTGGSSTGSSSSGVSTSGSSGSGSSASGGSSGGSSGSSSADSGGDVDAGSPADGANTAPDAPSGDGAPAETGSLADAAAETSVDAAPADAGVCTPGAVGCASGIQPRTCSASGTWQNGAACSSSQSCVNGACVTPSSCQTSGAGRTDCGAASESCCTSLEVTGGTFYRTYTNSGSGPTGEANPATLSGLRLDKYLVTVGRFRRFVNAWSNGAGYTPAQGSGVHTHLNGGMGLVDSHASTSTTTVYEHGWTTADNANVDPTDANLESGTTFGVWTPSPGTQENLPINYVTWAEAYAFCIWDGGFLPSEAEWKYAAAGGSQQLEYPWGSAAPGTSNQYAIYSCYYGGVYGCSDIAAIAPVGTATLGVGYWGQLDLDGDMAGWAMDWYATYVNPCTDCAYLTSGSMALRETSSDDFGGLPMYLTPSSRVQATPTQRFAGTGIRCARVP